MIDKKVRWLQLFMFQSQERRNYNIVWTSIILHINITSQNKICKNSLTNKKRIYFIVLLPYKIVLPLFFFRPKTQNNMNMNKSLFWNFHKLKEKLEETKIHYGLLCLINWNLLWMWNFSRSFSNKWSIILSKYVCPPLWILNTLKVLSKAIGCI